MHVGIVKDQQFESELKNLFEAIKKGDEAIEGLEWVLSREPEIGVPIPGTDIRAIPIYPENESFLVYYRLQGEEVTLLSIRPGDQEAGFL